MNKKPLAIPEFHAEDDQFLALISSATTPFTGGSTRTVYPIPGHDDKVLKVAKNGSNAANWVEAVIYLHLTDKSLFGKVLSVSQSGKFLVMERLDDVSADEVTNLQVPAWWTDRKRVNFGRSPCSGAVKIRDYALVNLNLGSLTPMPSADENNEMAKWLNLLHFN